MKELRVRIADYAVGHADSEILTLGLGSCVAIILHDAGARVGGLAHILLPDATLARDTSNPARFAESIVPVMLQRLAAMGSSGHVVGKLVGGASMFRSLLVSGGLNVGERNVAAARDALRLARVPLVAEDVGGDVGRSVRYSVREGTVTVKTVRGYERVI